MKKNREVVGRGDTVKDTWTKSSMERISKESKIAWQRRQKHLLSKMQDDGEKMSEGKADKNDGTARRHS